MCNVKQKEVSCVSSMIESDVKCFNYMSDLCTMQYLMHIAIDACWCVWNRSKIYLPYFVLILSVKSKIELYFLIIEILIRKSSYVGDVLSQTINHPTHPTPLTPVRFWFGGGGGAVSIEFTHLILYSFTKLNNTHRLSSHKSITLRRFMLSTMVQYFECVSHKCCDTLIFYYYYV